jgi:NADP-dependent 3-hydroxy acid dehydrogenase YdfG
MADMTEVAELSEWAMSEGDLHSVFHCAAKFTYGPVSTDRFEDCDLAIDSVLRATIRLTAHTLPSIRQNKGAYVYLCGPTSWTGWKNHAIHCATRHAQAGFAKGCEVCEFKTHCTTSTRRVVTRWEHEHLVDELQQRLDENPQAMRQRRETVEHPFGTIKMRMGATHFVMKRLKNVKTEKALNVLAYNLTRLMTILGPQQLIQAMKA